MVEWTVDTSRGFESIDCNSLAPNSSFPSRYYSQMFPHSHEDHKTSSLGKLTLYAILKGLPKPNPELGTRAGPGLGPWRRQILLVVGQLQLILVLHLVDPERLRNRGTGVLQGGCRPLLESNLNDLSVSRGKREGGGGGC